MLAMKIRFLLTAFIFSLASAAAAQPCLLAAREVVPVMSAETKAGYEKKLAEAEAVHLEKPNDADSIIWLGRRTAYLGRYKDAVRQFSSGIVLFPNDARFFRHRGHRYITLRCFDDAIKDFEKAAELTKGKPDEIEPDGLPNTRNIPTSTLNTNIWYHLGLAYYLKGDFKRAVDAFLGCHNAANNPDMKVASAHWVYMSLRRADKKKAATRFIQTSIPDGLDIIENHDYYKLVKLYQGKLKAEDLLKEAGSDTLGSASIGYGLGNWYLYSGKKEDAFKIFRQITAGNQWASFGYIAAEIDLGLE